MPAKDRASGESASKSDGSRAVHPVPVSDRFENNIGGNSPSAKSNIPQGTCELVWLGGSDFQRIDSPSRSRVLDRLPSFAFSSGALAVEAKPGPVGLPPPCPGGRTSCAPTPASGSPSMRTTDRSQQRLTVGLIRSSSSPSRNMTVCGCNNPLNLSVGIFPGKAAA